MEGLRLERNHSSKGDKRKMKELTEKKLYKILEEHKHWINEDCKNWEKMRADLREANIDLKEKIKDLRKTLNERSCVTLEEKLTKAKEIIKDYLTIAKGAHITVCGVSEENRTINVLKLNKEAEQFLNSEVEK